MAERPIIFSAEMVRAILDGRKTQTRRVIKLFKGNHSGSNVKCEGGKWLQYGAAGVWIDFPKCPYGQPGDSLWVKEAFQNDGIWGLESEKNCSPIFYRASPHGQYLQNNAPLGMKWKPSIFMPKRLARLWLKVKDVRVERVQDISEEDAQAEGVEATMVDEVPNGYLISDLGETVLISAVEEFSFLWDSINAKRGHPWGLNPWVWVIEFERVDHDQTKEKTD